MRQVVIENLVINSPFEEPRRHFRFDDEGITNEIVAGRRVSQYFMPTARTRSWSIPNNWTEGWDANTVTHILGVLAFGTQFLCEQVVGRGLRRMSYHAEPHTVTLASGETDTIRDTYKTKADKCHVSHMVGDTKSWEQKMAETLEDLPEVLCYVKNHGLGFLIPYTTGGSQRNYLPDFIARIDDGHGREDPLTMWIDPARPKLNSVRLSPLVAGASPR